MVDKNTYCCFCGREQLDIDKTEDHRDEKYVCSICIQTCLDIINNPNWDCQEKNKF